MNLHAEEVSDRIPEAKYKNKFFKFKIEKLLTKLRNDEGGPVEFNDSQWGMVSGLENHRFWVHIAGRRTGKSYAAAVLALTKLLEPDTKVAVVAPNFSLSTVIWDYLVRLIRELGLEVRKQSTKDRLIILTNYSEVRLLSVENRVSLIGRGYHFVIVDEAAVIDNDIYFNQDIRPTLSTYKNTRCLFISTPRGRHNYLYDYFQRGQPIKDGQEDKYPDWGSDIFTWRSNPRLQESEVMEAKNTMTKTLFAQEYECSWISFENMIYNVPEESKIADLQDKIVGKKMEYIAGLDMGFRDETAFIVMATDYDKYYIIDEYIVNETVTSDIARNIKELQETKADLANDYDIYCDNAIKAVEDGIGHVQNLLEKKKVLIDSTNCPRTLASLEQYKWSKTTTKPTPVHDKHSHCCDSVRYAIYSHQKTQVSIYNG
jgi:hypothetical protein